VTNIYPGTGDDEIDGVGQHAGMQVRVEGLALGGCSVAQVCALKRALREHKESLKRALREP
jgi:hypothetical protein